MVWKRYILPIGWLYATDPTFYKNLLQEILHQLLGNLSHYLQGFISAIVLFFWWEETHVVEKKRSFHTDRGCTLPTTWSERPKRRKPKWRPSQECIRSQYRECEKKGGWGRSWCCGRNRVFFSFFFCGCFENLRPRRITCFFLLVFISIWNG